MEEEHLMMLSQQAVFCPVFSSKLVIYGDPLGLMNPNISIFKVPFDSHQRFTFSYFEASYSLQDL